MDKVKYNFTMKFKNHDLKQIYLIKKRLNCDTILNKSYKEKKCY